jgi:hypothetical protein
MYFGLPSPKVGEVADYKAPSQLIGEFLREAAVLVAVLWPLEDGVKNARIDGSIMVFSLLSAGILMYGGSS